MPNCKMCGKPAGKWRGANHHIVPFSIGGRDTEDNLLWVCLKCHSIIHAVYTNEAMKKMLSDDIEFFNKCLHIARIRIDPKESLVEYMEKAFKRTQNVTTEHETTLKSPQT